MKEKNMTEGNRNTTHVNGSQFKPAGQLVLKEFSSLAQIYIYIYTYISDGYVII